MLPEVSLYSAEEDTLLKKNSLHKFGFRIKILDKDNYNISGYKIGDLYKGKFKVFFRLQRRENLC
jgi:hypothetical protein